MVRGVGFFSMAGVEGVQDARARVAEPVSQLYGVPRLSRDALPAGDTQFSVCREDAAAVAGDADRGIVRAALVAGFAGRVASTLLLCRPGHDGDAAQRGALAHRLSRCGRPRLPFAGPADAHAERR